MQVISDNNNTSCDVVIENCCTYFKCDYGSGVSEYPAITIYKESLSFSQSYSFKIPNKEHYKSLASAIYNGDLEKVKGFSTIEDLDKTFLNNALPFYFLFKILIFYTS